MKAVVFLGERELEIMDRPDPTPGMDEVVLEIRASGMCGTDLHQYRGPRRSPDQLVIAGHEPCGVIVEVGSAVLPQQAKVGDRVVVHHYDGCRVCHSCRSGWTQICGSEHKRTFGGLDADGAHARYMKVPAHTVIKMPDDLSFKAGAAAACGTGTAFGALKRLNLMGDETIAIFGQGPVGMSGTLLAKAMGARVIALDVSPERLEMAKRFGADVVINPMNDDPVTAIRDVTRRGEGADKTMECSSNGAARRQSVESLRRWGTACLVGVFGEITFDVGETIQRMKTVVGSQTFSKNLLDDCVHYIAEHKLDVEDLFTHEFTLDEAKRAYELFDTQKIGKGVFLFD
ncbi:zinc-binding dehydrogenase [Roseovarius pacificus]|uniref:zinc-dependent alcohol dehydrogenase family protein n=1 Tax=Roseovarius pacificus TaxID=337701 RepID=UPI002A18B28C|nr:zinc-binding dehydrogenase [Roseovarius pacificus]